MLKVRIHGAILRAMAKLHRVSTPKIVAHNIGCNVAPCIRAFNQNSNTFQMPMTSDLTVTETADDIL